MRGISPTQPASAPRRKLTLDTTTLSCGQVACGLGSGTSSVEANLHFSHAPTSSPARSTASSRSDCERTDETMWCEAEEVGRVIDGGSAAAAQSVGPCEMRTKIDADTTSAAASRLRRKANTNKTESPAQSYRKLPVSPALQLATTTLPSR